MNRILWAGVVLAIAGAALAGYLLRKPDSIVETVFRDRIVTQRVTERSTTTDGTVRERVEEHIASDSKKRDVPAKESQVDAYRPDYSIGAQWRDDDVPSVAEFGYRLMGNMWLEGRYDWKRREPTVGVRIEF